MHVLPCFTRPADALHPQRIVVKARFPINLEVVPVAAVANTRRDECAVPAFRQEGGHLRKEALAEFDRGILLAGRRKIRQLEDCSKLELIKTAVQHEGRCLDCRSHVRSHEA